MKLAAEVGLGEIFQTPFGSCFPTFGLSVSGGGPISGLRISENPVFDGVCLY